MVLFVAAHKAYEMPKDPLYQPLFVGAKGRPAPMEGCVRDDEGENITEKNPYYCELTGLYWAWKNSGADAYGMVQYRRHFSLHPVHSRHPSDRIRCALSLTEADELLAKYDGVVPQKRRYVIESLFSHYEHTIGEPHLVQAKQIIESQCPEYLPYVEKAYRQTWGYMFNMFLFKKEYADAYCQWIFDILSALEKEIPLNELSTFHKRLFGRVSEVLFNAWIKKAQAEGMKVTEVPVLSIESENWVKRGTAFLQAKFLGIRYEESF